jgi:hypothetical protein
LSNYKITNSLSEIWRCSNSQSKSQKSFSAPISHFFSSHTLIQQRQPLKPRGLKPNNIPHLSENRYISKVPPLRLASDKSAPVTIGFFKVRLTNFTPRRSQRMQLLVRSRVSTLALIWSISCWDTFSANSGET